MVNWHKSWIEFRCSKCGKAIRPGRRIGLERGAAYCYRCGHNRELAFYHRLYDEFYRHAVNHMRAIGVERGDEQERLSGLVAFGGAAIACRSRRVCGACAPVLFLR